MQNRKTISICLDKADQIMLAQLKIATMRRSTSDIVRYLIQAMHRKVFAHKLRYTVQSKPKKEDDHD